MTRAGPRRGIWLIATCLAALLAGPFAAAPSASPAASPATAPAPGARGMTVPARLSYFAWYDNASIGVTADNIHVLNPGDTPAQGSISLPGAALAFNLAPGQEGYFAFPAGTAGGPVKIAVSSGPPVTASQRTLFNQSLTEVGSLSAADAFVTGYFNWFDNTTIGMTADYIHLVNPAATPVSGTVQLGSTSTPFTIGGFGEQHVTFPAGSIGGAVKVQVTGGGSVLASQRVAYSQSLNEVWALPAVAAATNLWLPWYDQAGAGMNADFLHVLNPGSVASAVTLTFGSTSKAFTVQPGAEVYASFPGAAGGPLTITASQPVLASQRILYYQDFEEQNAFAAADAASTWLFNWYDNGSPGFLDHVHVTNPGAAPATVNLFLPGRLPIPLTVAAGQDGWYAFPAGTVSGPLRVQVASGPAVIASLRAFVYLPPPPPPPPPVVRAHKIVVSLGRQHLWAYDGTDLILETDITTGRPELPTPPGDYRIFTKQTPFEFISPWPYGNPFWYPSAWVSYAMEFISGGYYLHDAPWRSWYGPGSNNGDGTHGCVNIPIDPMTQLFQWAQLGDEVVVTAD